MEKTPFWHRCFCFWYIQDYHHQYEGQKDPYPDHWARDTGAMLPTNSHQVSLLRNPSVNPKKPPNPLTQLPITATRPHIIHILADDMGWAEVGVGPSRKNHSMGWDSVLSNEWALWLVESMDSFVNVEVSSNYMAQFVDMEIRASNIGASRLSDWCEIWSRVSSTLCRLPSRRWWWCQDTQHRCIGQAGAGSTWWLGLTRISRMFCI